MIDIVTARPALSPADFEKIYIAVRQQEQRLYPDHMVEQLPFIHASHVHAKEWQIRKRSSDRLTSYLKRKKRPLRMLEVGCGNGWLSAKLATIPHSLVTGIDINQTEIRQAKRVFKNAFNLCFDVMETLDLCLDKRYDVIVFAASIQYVADFEKIIDHCLSHLKKDGEVHILDSFFYRPDEIEDARKRSEAYYASIGYHSLSKFYFHHSVGLLSPYHHSYLFNPAAFLNRVYHTSDPFPWVRITSA